MSDGALDATLAFATEADRLKTVDRANVLTDSSRPENAAEHSWHLALAALVLAPDDVDVDRAVAMALVHDLVEIDAGDHPVHLPHDGQRAAEATAADRLFALHPGGPDLRALWQAFEDGSDATARFVKRLDHILPVLQVAWNPAPPPDHMDISRHTLTEGRAATLRTDWPEAHAHATALLDRAEPVPGDLAQAFAFLAEADRLKTIIRATKLTDASRHENSGEHSWHVALMALTLAPWAPDAAAGREAVRMLILHDLVEIDAGDAPIFGTIPHPEAAETAAADRLFALLPQPRGTDLRALWDRFEAARTPSARFAKAIDRVQPPVLNLANGGGSWVDYAVTEDRVRTRIGPPIQGGAPALWDWLSPRIAAHFEG